MSFLSGLGRVKLDGQKGLTKDKPIKVIDAPECVYVPLVIGTATQFDIHVAEGDHVCVGTKLATRKDMYVPIYSPISGTVKGFEKRMHATGRPQNHVVIENDGQNETVKVLDIADVEAMSAQEIVDAMKELGLVGLGGSGFPTYIKYGNVQNITTVVINGVECEPFITSDHVAMKRDVKALFDGVSLMKKAADASLAVIAIKKGKPDLLALLNAEVANYPGIEVKEVPDVYPMGWERTLVKQLTKKDYDRFPSEVGVIVNNASTAIALSKGIRNGEAITKRIVTVSGNGVKDPQNVEVVVGTPFNQIIEAIGGYADASDGFVLSGGPMMGKSVMNDQFVISSYTNSVTCMIRENIESLPCLKCGECTSHCPAHLQPVKIIQAEKRADVEMLEKLDVMRCIECGMCTYICPSKIEVTDFVSKAKRRVNLANIKKNAAAKKK
jgi:electron transport complex, RnfABCDGE type, C subunit